MSSEKLFRLWKTRQELIDTINDRCAAVLKMEQHHSGSLASRFLGAGQNPLELHLDDGLETKEVLKDLKVLRVDE